MALNPNENQEWALREIASEHNDNTANLKAVWAAYATDKAQVWERHKEAIRQALNAFSKSDVKLFNAVTASEAAIWEKTKQRVVGTIRYGWESKQDKVTWDDDQEVFDAMEEHLTQDQIDSIVITKRTLSKKALKDLPDETLEKIGVRRVAGQDEVIVKDTEVDMSKTLKLLAADGFKVEK